MLSPLQSFLLGVVQGLAEFLPISSSAHLVLLPRFFQWPEQGLAFDVALHLGTLAAVMLYFWRTLAMFSRSLLHPVDPAYHPERRLLAQIVVATIPGAIAGLLLEHKVETVFRSPAIIGVTLIVMGFLLFAADRLSSGGKTINQITWGTALLIGVSQGLALIPGVSRSGITITAALFLGLQRSDAARFSFLMSMPIIAGAGMLKFKEIWLAPDQTVILAGLLGAFISGFFAIWFLIHYVQTRRYTPFVIYRWVLGALVLLNLG